ncbi:MAG: electron transfer flavoprotein subunit alpha, partial [Candidatus Bathyarchaeota archaeon]|nr:electron transfer flavoprotein subunit alpha [Candidatus Bathyarchaeota archaeon]
MGEPKGVWVFSENKDLTLELLGKGNELADKLQTELAAVLLGQNVENQANELIGFGADRVYMVDNPQFKNLHAESYVSALTSLAKQYEPDVLLIGSTKRGKEVASRVATRLETGCVPDCTHLSIDENKRLLIGRMVYGGNAVATHFSRAKPQIAT